MVTFSFSSAEWLILYEKKPITNDQINHFQANSSCYYYEQQIQRILKTGDEAEELLNRWPSTSRQRWWSYQSSLTTQAFPEDAAQCPLAPVGNLFAFALCKFKQCHSFCLKIYTMRTDCGYIRAPVEQMRHLRFTDYFLGLLYCKQLFCIHETFCHNTHPIFSMFGRDNYFLRLKNT